MISVLVAIAIFRPILPCLTFQWQCDFAYQGSDPLPDFLCVVSAMIIRPQMVMTDHFLVDVIFSPNLNSILELKLQDIKFLSLNRFQCEPFVPSGKIFSLIIFSFVYFIFVFVMVVYAAFFFSFHIFICFLLGWGGVQLSSFQHLPIGTRRYMDPI